MRHTIDHIHLRSRDAIAAARFYVDVLGASEIRRIGEPVTRMVLDLGGLNVFIEQAPDGLPPGAAPQHLGLEHIGLRVDDIEAAVANLASHGISLVSGITVLGPELRIAFFNGPDAVRIELLERR